MSVREGQARLRRLSNNVANDLPHSKEDKDFLSSALMQIASGDDAERALGVKAKRGERKGLHDRQTKIDLVYAMGWIANAIRPLEDGGLGYSLKQAISKAKILFSLLPSEDSLLRYWNDYPDKDTPTFNLDRIKNLI